MHSGVKCGDIHTTYINFMAHWFIVMADYNIKQQIMMGKKLSDVLTGCLENCQNIMVNLEENCIFIKSGVNEQICSTVQLDIFSTWMILKESK